MEVIENNNHLFCYIEITGADMNHNEHLRTESLIEEGRVSLTGTVTSSGTKKSGLSIKVSNSAQRDDIAKKKKEAAIHNAICQKSSGNYPNNTILLVYFDDYVTYSHERDCDDMFAFMESIEDTWTNTFTSLYLVGQSGRRGWLKLKPEPEFSPDTVLKMDAQMNSVSKRHRSPEVIEYTRITNEEEL